MKVLHVGAGNLYGGIEAVLVAVAAARDAAPGVEHEFALCFEGRVARELRATGAAVHLLGEVRVRRPWSVWRARRRLRALLAAREVDVVLAHGPWCFALVAPAVRRAGRRLALFAHGELRGAHWTERWAARTRPDVIVANSAFTARSAEALHVGVPRRVVHCPVPPPGAEEGARREALRRALGAGPDDVVVVMASRVEALKGHDVLLDALARLDPALPVRCWIVGGAQRPHEQRLRDDLERRATRLGVAGRVAWLGQRDDVRALLAAADVYCQPNTAPDAFGVVFVEALHAGLPVVTSAIGGAVEIVDETCGVLVAPGDGAALAAALSDLARSPGRRQALGAAGPARARALCEPAGQVVALSAALRGGVVVHR